MLNPAVIAALVVLAMTAFARAGEVATTGPGVTGDEYHTTVLPLLQKYCYECHGEGMDSGDLEMDSYTSLADLRGDTKTWQKVIQYARTQTMPPPKADQPTQAERDALVEALQR